MSSNNDDAKFISQLFKSDIVKTFTGIIMFSVIMVWNLSSAKNDLEKTIKNLAQSIEVQNLKLENRIQNIEDRQERDFRFFSENYVKKIELLNRER